MRLAAARRPLEAALRLLAALLVLLAVAGPVHADAEVTQMRLERSEDGVLLNASVAFELPPAVEDALQKGIPMFFVAEATLLRDRWYWYDKQVAFSQRHMRLSYQPLTRRWRLQVSPTAIGNSGLALGQSFDTREEALRAVQSFARWKIAELSDLEPDARYSLDFRFRLDVSQLPRPFQIGVVGQADWNVGAARTQRIAVENGR
ncbi:DUF4390 domain-containing protein [Ramlibacter sp. MAH-25]|jgi:hypothetical protein|uniref:DUF4390 domain-containing protein n=2 Tax=Comamonadaceae TaxID=80864 RepID=A0A6N8IU70_9BURK|nr:DUF4390 domain-containing protein [Ramlibacter sp. CGMCC 1.13660]MVQ30378.1 DUF4390 domain-containing protein [Ramlibacter pinisoli]